MRGLRTLPAIEIVHQCALVGNDVLDSYGITLKDASGVRHYLFDSKAEVYHFLKGLGYLEDSE